MQLAMSETSRHRILPGVAFMVWLRSAAGQLQLLLALAVIFGGGGVGAPLFNLIVQLGALLVLAMQPRAVRAFAMETPRPLQLLLLLTLAIPLLQVVPLPPALWRSLPGRDLVSEVMLATGVTEPGWFPLSVHPVRTFIAFASLIAPATIIVIGSSLSEKHRTHLLIVFGALAGLCVLLGAAQASAQGEWFQIHAVRETTEVLTATFANRNSSGVFFVLALYALAALPWQNWPRSIVLPGIAGGGLLALATILTQSRSSMVLLFIPLALMGWRAFAVRIGKNDGLSGAGGSLAISAVLIALVFGTALALSTLAGGRTAGSFARFAETQTDRPAMWEDAFTAAAHYAPLGSGMGTFDDVFQIHESLENVSPRRAGRAHSDWIEIVIEAGYPALLLALAWLGWGVRRGFAAGCWSGRASAAGILCIALQSLVDYPLRTQTLLCIAAVFVVMLAPSGREEKV